jgi:hypothetical protein
MEPAILLPRSLRIQIEPRFSFSWLRTESRQTPIGIKQVQCNWQLPWRHRPPQKTVGTGPCPKGNLTKALAISRDVSASPEVTHSLDDPVIRKQGRRKTGVQSMPWLQASQVTGSPACAEPLSKTSRHIKRLLLAQHVVIPFLIQ